MSYLFAIQISQGMENNQRQVLTIGGFYASGKMTTFQNASGIIQTVNEAVRSINERSQLLPGYKLEIEWKDTKVCWKYMSLFRTSISIKLASKTSPTEVYSTRYCVMLEHG